MQNIKSVVASVSLKRVLLDWLIMDAPALTYMAKATIAGLLALFISMALTLPDPRTAIFTSFLVMQPQSGLVFSKSYYRVLGTIAGVFVSLLLIGMFAQDSEWFIAFFAIWIGICTAAGLKYRNFQSYGFVLGGYTVCIVALPVIEMPLEIFDIAVSRFSEVIIGIMSATLVSDIIFPRKLSNSLLASERERFSNMISTLADERAIFDISGDSQSNIAGFSGVVGLHAVRINSSFESGADRKNRQHSSQLNQEYMNLSTSYHSLRSTLISIEPHTAPEVLISLQKIYSPLATVLSSSPQRPLTVEDLELSVGLLLEAKEEMAIRFDRAQNSLMLSLNSDDYEAFRAAATLIIRLLNEVHIHHVTYLSFLKHRLSGKVSREFSRVVRFSTHTDNLLVALAAIRGSGVLLVTMAFWMLSGWPYATLSVTLAVVLGLLIGTMPSPLDTVKNFFKGALAGIAVAALYDFYIIPKMTSDMLTLSLVLVPILALVAWWTTKPKWSGFALGFIFLFMYQCSLDPFYRVDATVFFESSLAYLIGIIFAGTAYLLVNFWSCSLTQQRVAKLLRSQIVTLCSGPITIQRSSLESTGRDLVQQFSTHGRLNVRSSHLVFEWLLSTLEIGRGVITIRRNRKRWQPCANSQSIDEAIFAIKEYFLNPTLEMHTTLLIALKQALTQLHATVSLANETELKRINKVIDELSLIRTIIFNENSLPIVKEDRCP